MSTPKKLNTDNNKVYDIGDAQSPTVSEVARPSEKVGVNKLRTSKKSSNDEVFVDINKQINEIESTLTFNIKEAQKNDSENQNIKIEEGKESSTVSKSLTSSISSAIESPIVSKRNLIDDKSVENADIVKKTNDVMYILE